MFEIKIYDLDNTYEFMADMIKNNKPIFNYYFEQPNTEEDFNKLINKIDYEGYLYELLKDNKPYTSGIVTADSLYDDIMR